MTSRFTFFQREGNDTPTIRVDPRDPDKELLERAAHTVRSGGVIAYPTETVYGLGADPFNIPAIERIFGIKGRSPEKAISILIPHRDMLPNLCEEIPADIEKLIAKFWPGPLTVVFRAQNSLPKELLAGGDSVAVRLSSNPLVEALMKRLQSPITSTSANISGHPASRSALHVAVQFEDKIDLIIDGGISPSSKPSTVIAFLEGKVRILREGAITADEIKSV